MRVVKNAKRVGGLHGRHLKAARKDTQNAAGGIDLDQRVRVRAVLGHMLSSPLHLAAMLAVMAALMAAAMMLMR